MSLRVLKGPGFEWLPSTLADLKSALRIDGLEHSGFVTIGEQEFYLKLTTVSPRSRLRGLLRSTGPLVRPPRIREFDNLLWLRSAGLPAPAVALAMAERTYGLLSAQLILTARIADALDLRTYLAENSQPAERLRVIKRVGREVGALHAAGFFHRDLYLRNVLVVPGSARPTVSFIDCHRGTSAPLRPLREAYDLGCFELWAPSFLSEDERRAFYAGYFESHPADARRLARAILRVRRKQVQRYLSKRHAPMRSLLVLDAPVLQLPGAPPAAASSVLPRHAQPQRPTPKSTQMIGKTLPKRT